jgi:hypothetical protein
MAKNSIRDYSATNSDNTDIQSIDIGEGCSPAGINNAIREVMADTADFVSGTVGIDVLSLTDDANTYAMKFQAPTTLTATTTFTLPDGDGTDGQAILTDGAGTLSWGSVDSLTGIQTFTSSGTYTPTAGTTKVLVYVVGGGGAGGGVDGQGGGTAGAGGGGGGGGCAISFVTSLGATETVTVGAGGVGTNGATTGGSGGASSFGSHAAANGAGGGQGKTANSPSNVSYTSGGAGASGTIGDIQFTGTCGGHGAAGGSSTSESMSGTGGSSFFGGGERGRSGDQKGLDGRNYGGGGSGAVVTSINTNYAGGDGADGIVVIYEYQ